MRSSVLASAIAWSTSRTNCRAASGIAIARALVNTPSILLADEPTGNLDSHTSSEIMEVFEELHTEGQTILLITHEHDIATHATRQIHLLDGLVERDEITEKTA